MGTKWDQVEPREDQVEANGTQVGTRWAKWDQVGTKGTKWDQVGSKWDQLGTK